MKTLKVLNGICIGMVIVGISLMIGLVGGIENDSITIKASILPVIGSCLMAGIGVIGLNYVEAKEAYIRKHRRY